MMSSNDAVLTHYLTESDCGKGYVLDKIKFGTDGWRGILADNFTFERVTLVAQAIARHIIEKGLNERSLIIAHDARFLGAELASLCAHTVQAAGLDTVTFAHPMPTPIVAYAIKARKAAGAIMLTASHNPPEYNGIKFIPDYAGPANTEITKSIEALLGKSLKAAARPGSDTVADVLDAYIEQLRSVVNRDVIASAEPLIVVDPMHGAGCGVLATVLQDFGADCRVINGDYDPCFGGHEPDPVRDNLSALSAAVRDSGALLGLAVDGDGDRFGVIDHHGAWLSPNQVISVLAEYLLARGSSGGALVRTVATTHYLDRIAANYGVPLIETPVGFKWIAAEMMRRDVIIGGEESGGLSVGGHIPEKDGILACLLVLEATLALDRSPSGQLSDIAHRYGERYSRRLDVRVGEERKTQLMAELTEKEMGEIAGQSVSSTVLLDGAKFVLDTGDWLLVRPSGTEPLVRVYLEAGSEERLAELSAFATSIMT